MWTPTLMRRTRREWSEAARGRAGSSVGGVQAPDQSRPPMDESRADRSRSSAMAPSRGSPSSSRAHRCLATRRAYLPLVRCMRAARSQLKPNELRVNCTVLHQWREI